jgi:NAD(P)-dependent dehydrogenase (short-subunit alcohol dehydrogenase family)
METPKYKKALIVGAGAGLSASLARLFAKDGMRIALAARDAGKLASLAQETEAACIACDVSQPDDVARMFAQLDAVPDVVVFNPSARVRGPVTELDPAEVARVIAISAFGGFLVGQAAARAMLPRGSGTIIFTGASASVKGYPLSSSFAMGKFALRGLAQSMARELAPKGIHIGHVVIDGGIRSETRRDPNDAPDSLLDPDAIAESYLHLVKQHRSAWTWEIEVRPWVERF